MHLLIHSLCQELQHQKRLLSFVAKLSSHFARITLQFLITPALHKQQPCGFLSEYHQRYPSVQVEVYVQRGWCRGASWDGEGHLEEQHEATPLTRTQWLGYCRQQLMQVAREHVEHQGFDVLWCVDSDLCSFGTQPQTLRDLCERRDWQVLSAWGTNAVDRQYGDLFALQLHAEEKTWNRAETWWEGVQKRREWLSQHTTSWRASPAKEAKYEGFLTARYAFGWSTLYRIDARLWQASYLSACKEDAHVCEHQLFQRAWPSVSVSTSWCVVHP